MKDKKVFKRKLIIPQVSPVLASLIGRLSLRDLAGLGYLTEIVDLSYIVNRDRFEYSKNSDQLFNGDEFIRVARFFSIEELCDYFESGHCDDIWLIPFHDHYEVRCLFRLIDKYKVKYAYINGIYADPEPIGTSNGITLKEKLSLPYIKKFLYFRLLKKWLRTNRPAFLTIPSRAAEHHYVRLNAAGKNVKKVFVHTVDYDNFLKAEPYESDKPYCVFVDQYLPFHPDIIFDLKYHIEPDGYYKTLNEVFDQVRKRFHLKIIVAAHPRADYRDKMNYLPLCAVEYGKTASLIKGADLVIGHNSNSLAMAAMANCPLIVYVSHALLRSRPEMELMEWYGNELGARLLKDGDRLQDSDLSIDEEKYQSFIAQRAAYDLQNTELLWKTITDEVERCFSAPGHIG